MERPQNELYYNTWESFWEAVQDPDNSDVYLPDPHDIQERSRLCHTLRELDCPRSIGRAVMVYEIFTIELVKRLFRKHGRIAACRMLRLLIPEQHELDEILIEERERDNDDQHRRSPPAF